MYLISYIIVFMTPFYIYIYILKVKCFLLKSDLSTRHRLYVQKTDGKIFGVVVNNFDQVALAGSSCYGSLNRQLSNKGIGFSVVDGNKVVAGKGGMRFNKFFGIVEKRCDYIMLVVGDDHICTLLITPEFLVCCKIIDCAYKRI